MSVDPNESPTASSPDELPAEVSKKKSVQHQYHTLKEGATPAPFPPNGCTRADLEEWSTVNSHCWYSQEFIFEAAISDMVEKNSCFLNLIKHGQLFIPKLGDARYLACLLGLHCANCRVPISIAQDV